MTAPLEVLQESLTHWRKTKHPRFAELAEWSTTRALAAAPPRPLVGAGKKKADAESWRALLNGNDPLDLPRLVQAVGGGNSSEAVERITLLSKLNDPRVTSGLLQLLSAPPYRARTAIGFFRAAVKALQDSGDPRVRPALEDLAARYKSILETTVGDDVAGLLMRAVRELDQVKPGPLPAALEKKASAFEALFESERTKVERGAAKQKSAKHDDNALLAAVYAAPDDDAPRLVFADSLTERGDVRGEFIALQIARARGKATPEQRMREIELSRDAKLRAAWGLPLSRGAECHLSRGFPDELMLEPRMFKTIVGDPALATVRSVSGFERSVSVKQAVAFLTHESASRVTRIGSLELELLEKLPTPLRWQSVGVQFIPDQAQRALFANVRELKLPAWGAPVKAGALVGYEQLEKVQAGNVEPGALSQLTGVRELEVLGWMKDFPWQQELAGLKQLRRLLLRSSPAVAQLAGLSLEALSVNTTPDLDPDGLIGALPNLAELQIDCSENSVRPVLEKLLASKRMSRLRVASVGNFRFIKPWTAEGTLEVRVWNRSEFEKHAPHVALIPEGCVSKILVRPRHEDPWLHSGVAPEEAAIQAVRASTKIPVELAWF